MALMTVTQLQKITDKMAVAFEQMKAFAYSPGMGGTVVASTSPVAGTYFNILTNLENYIAATGDFEVESDLGPNVRTARLKAWVRWVMNDMKIVCSQLNDHCAARGPEVSNSILDLLTFINYYNGGLGAAKFGCLVHPSFAELYNFLLTPTGTFPVLGTFSPGIHPNLPDVGTGAANGLGTKTVAGVYTHGTAVNTTYYQGVNLVLETIVSFTGGGAAPSVVVTGTDDLGNAAQTWTGTLVGNNPSATLTCTVTPAVAAHSYGSRVVSSSTNFAVGQVVIIDSGLSTQESVVIEAIADGTHLTFAARKAHQAGATITAAGAALALTVTGSGRRCVDISAIALTLSSHSAGTVRICGAQDRMGDPA